MKNKKTKIIAVLALGGVVAGILPITTNTTGFGLFKVKGGQSWYHYASVEATCARHGISEYWTDCNGTTLLEQPEGITFTERTLTQTQIEQIVADEFDERLTPKKDHTCDWYNPGYVIGYKVGTCIVCGGTDQKVSVDQDIANAGKDWGICSRFGGNGTALKKDDLGEFPEYADLEGCKSAWLNNGPAGSVINVLLPKVNYTVFNKVSFVLHTNSEAKTNTSFGIGLTESGEDLFTYSPRGLRDQYIVTFEYSEGKLNGSVTSYLVSKTFTIEDDGAETGSTSVQLFVKMGAWRRLVLDSVQLNHEKAGGVVVVDDFSTSKYGAEAGAGVTLGIGQDSYKNCLRWQDPQYNPFETTIGLPKITYKNYDKVVFNLFLNGGDSKSDIVGFDAGRSSIISTKDGHTLTVYKAEDGTYKARIDLINGNTNPSFEMTIEDEDVLNGVNSFYGVYCKTAGKWRTICVTSIEVNPAE